MYKKIISLLFLCLTYFAANLKAQDSQREAKAAYMLAEESYGKGDYKSTLEFLQQAKKALGTTNCKLLYLQIMATRELYAKDSNNAEKLVPLIAEFEKSTDYADFNEEKTMEVSKLKLLANLEIKTAREKRDKENAANAALEKAFSDEFNRFGPWNVTIEQLDSAMPSLKVKEWKRIEKWDSYSPQGFIYDKKSADRTGSNWLIEKGVDYKGKIGNIVFLNNRKIFKYQSFLVYNDAKDDETGAFNEANETISAFTKKLGFEPVRTDKGTYVHFAWQRGDRIIALELLFKQSKKTIVGPVQLLESVYHL